MPIKADGRIWGAILLVWPHADPLTSVHIDPVRSFAHRAGIAIDNARLLQESRPRTADVEEPLEQQKGSAGSLTVISQSVADTKR